MKVFKSVFNQLRYDFLCLGWIMALWAVWIALDAITGWQRWHGSVGGDRHHTLVLFSNAINSLAGAVLVALLAPALAFGHSIWRSDGFWRTRPIPLRRLFATRFLFLFGLFGLIPLVTRAGVMIASGFEITLSLVSSAGYMLVFLTGATVLWGFAMLFQRWRFLIIAAVTIVCLWFALVAGLGRLHFFRTLAVFRTPAEFDYPVSNAVPPGLRESQLFVGLIVLMTGGLLTAAVLFRWRQRNLGVAATSFAMIFAVMTPWWWQTNLFEANHLGSVRSSAQPWVVLPSKSGSNVEGDLNWNDDEIPGENWLGVLEFTTDYPLSSGPFSIRAAKSISRLGSAQAIRTALEGYGTPLIGGPALADARSPFSETPIKNVAREKPSSRVSFPVISGSWRRPMPWHVEGEIHAHWFGHEVAGSIPLKTGARFVKDGIVIPIEAVRLIWDAQEVRQTLAIDLIADRRGCLFTGNDDWRLFQSWSPFEDWHLAIEIPAGDDANPDGPASYHLGRLSPTGFPESRAGFRIPVYDRSNPDEPPLITAERLKDCRLIVLRPVYRETMSASFEGGGDR